MTKLTTLFSTLLVFTIAVLFTQQAFAQGSTTSSISGLISSTDGETLPGANVIALHTPSGFKYGTTTRTDGRFNLPNVRVGGPYTITVSFIGYKETTIENVYLTLGEDRVISTSITPEDVELEAVEIIAGGLLGSEKNGAETNVSETQIAAIPTATRSISDYVKLTPQVNTNSGSGGISIAGANNRYNAIFIDGAVNNDVFGLASSGTNGGQTGASPVSMDAIEQFQVVVAPYDVTLGGFTGGGINAVTRSGSNEFQGSLYWYTQNQNMVGKTPTFDLADDAERTKVDDFSNNLYGLRLGGPIIKNKLFFFASAELQRDQTPRPFDFGTYDGDATQADLDALVNKLNGYGYDPGGFLENTNELKSNKFLGRLDWNLSERHSLTLRHSYTKAEEISVNGSSPRTLNFFNSGIYFPSTTNSTAIELNSLFSNELSNNLIVGYTTVRDDRDPLGADFPYLNIEDGSGSIRIGSEQFSTANALDQNIFTITNNLRLYKGKHNITIGTHNEFFSIYNLFIRQNYGVYEYDSLSQFMNDLNPSAYIRSYSLVDDITGDGSAGAAEFNAMQLGFYAQDEISLSNKFKLTAGLRLDIPIFSATPEEDTYFNNTTIPMLEAAGYDLKGARAGQMPKTKLMLSPRLGFNYDVDGERNTIIRGGLGIFTGRIPFVWPGGAYNNNGLTIGGTFQGSPDIVFNPTYDNQPEATDFGGTDPIPSGQMDLFVEDFKYPQVFRGSLALDKKLPGNMIFSLEGIFTKTLNNIFYENLNLKPSTSNLTGTPDDRPIFDRRDEVDPTYTRILLGSNTNEGYTYNITAQVQKPFTNGLDLSLAYTFGRAASIFDGTSSQNSSQWRGVHSINGRNNAPLGRSDFDLGSRIVGAVSYQANYFKFGGTTFSLFYNGQSGSPYTYIYNDGGRLNNEDSRERSMIYVPASQSDVILVDDGDRTAAQQWTELDQFISDDKYLSERRGQYAEKNMSRTPFENTIDFRILQDFFVTVGKNKHQFQLSYDILNLGNLVNKNWGRKFNTSFGNYELLNFEGFQEDGTTPTFTFDSTDEPYFIADFASRWKMNVGVRYIFNK